MWCEEDQAEQKKKNVKLFEDQYQQLMEEYEREKKNHKETGSLPSVDVIRGEDDRFLVVQGCDHLRCSRIEKIYISYKGKTPSITKVSEEGDSIWYYALKKGIDSWPYSDKRTLPDTVVYEISPNLATITILLVSGIEEEVHCYDFQVEDLLQKIRSAWQGSKD